MQRTPSRASPSGGRWRMATIPAMGGTAQGPPQLEFTVINASCSGSSGNGKDVDGPAHAAGYRLYCPGGFKLQHGRLHPFPRACAAASMLVRTPGMFNAPAHLMARLNATPSCWVPAQAQYSHLTISCAFMTLIGSKNGHQEQHA